MMNQEESKSQSTGKYRLESYCTTTTQSDHHHHRYHQKSQHNQRNLNYKRISSSTSTNTFISLFRKKQKQLRKSGGRKSALDSLAHVMLTSYLLITLISLIIGSSSSSTSVFAQELDDTPTSTQMDSSESIVTNFGSGNPLDSSPSPWTTITVNANNLSLSTAFPEEMHVYNASSYKELELLSGPVQGLMSWLYGLTAAAALIGNIIAVLVLIKGKRMSKGTLRFFLINLALSDINVAAFSIPFTYDDFMKGRWEYWLFFCPVVQCMQITSVFVSVYTLAAIGIDR